MLVSVMTVAPKQQGLWQEAIVRGHERWLRLLYHVLLVQSTDKETIMAGQNVIFETAKFIMADTPGSVPATELRLKWGTAPGVYPNTKVYPAVGGQDLIKNVLPGPGQYYAILVEANSIGEGSKTPELPFVAGSGLPNGSLTFSIG
jgi:hypothetical protein